MSTNGTTFPLTSRGALEVWDQGSQADITATTYGVNGGGILHGRLARGTAQAPAPVKAGDIVAGIGGRAYYAAGAAGRWQMSSPTSIHWVASEDQTQYGFGSYLRVLTTAKGTTNRHERLVVADNGTLWVHDEHPGHDAKLDGHTRPVPTVRINVSACSAPGAAYGATAYGTPDPGYRGLRAGGTPTAPQNTPAGRYLVFLGGHGYDGAGWGEGTQGLFGIKATEVFTRTGKGTVATVETTAKGDTQRRVRLTVDEKGVYFHRQDGGIVNLVAALDALR